MPNRTFSCGVCTGWLQRMLMVGLLLVPVLAQAVVRDYYFRLLDSRQGLSQSSVTAMLQDQKGYVWVATQGDLHRFDGYNFQTVSSLIGTEPLPSFALTLAEGEPGYLYVGTILDGLFVIDRMAHRVEPLQVAAGSEPLPKGRIERLFYQLDKGLWVASPHGVGLFDPETRHYRTVLSFPSSQATRIEGSITNTVRALALDRAGQLWVGANHGLYRLDTHQKKTEKVNDENIGALLVDVSGVVWAGTPGGLTKIARTWAESQRVWPRDRDKTRTELPCCDVITLAQAADGALWLSVREGNLWRYDPVLDDSRVIPVNPWVDGMMGEAGVRHLMVDRSNLLWLGGSSRGIATAPASGATFQGIFDTRRDQDPLGGNYIRAIAEDKSGQWWLGTEAGLTRYDRVQDRFESFDIDFSLGKEGKADKAPIPLGISPMADGTLWLATNKGLFHFDPASQRADVTIVNDVETTDGFTSMMRARDGTLWLGRYDQGLLLYHPATRVVRAIPPEPGVEGQHHLARINALLEDSRGRVWLGGMLGISLFDPVRGVFRNFSHDPRDSESLSGNIVRAIHETRDGTLWIGSHDGLDQVVEAPDGSLSFQHWALNEDGVSQVVYAIGEDTQGYLWVSGNHGLVRIDRREKTLWRFGLESGLQGLEFNGSAITTLRDGRLVFGGSRGLNIVDPDRIHRSEFNAPVTLSWLRSGKQSLMEKFSPSEPIRIHQEDRILSVGFAALDYAQPDNNLFSYRLEGLESEFSAPSTQRWTLYTNLDPGRYTFRVRASNHDGHWSSEELQIPIQVLPPWWRSPWVHGAYLALAILAVFLLWRSQQKRYQAKAQLVAQILDREERLKLSLWGAGDWFWDWDLRTNQIYRIGADQALQRSQSEQLDMEDWHQNAIHPDDLNSVQQLMQEHLSGRSDHYESEHRLRTGSGEWRWIRTRGKVVERDAESNPLRVAGTARDITDSRHAERERRIATEVLRSMNEAVAVIDLNLRFISVNPAFSRITGYREQDVVGMSISLLDSTRHPVGFFDKARESLRTEGHQRGEIWLRRANGEEFLSWMEMSEVGDAKGSRTHYVAVVNDITDKKRIEQELRYLANYDTLTGLPNRTLLFERLARTVVKARRHGTRVAVLFMDLDHFKLINDSLGHAAGDRILKATAARLQGVAGSTDTVARLGGDEFTIVMEDVSDTNGVAAMAEAIIASFGEPVLGDEGSEIIISPSVGIALYPEHASVPTDLLKFADAAMYRAKERGRNTYQFFDESMDAELRLRASMSAALRRALERNELHLEFQPRLALFDNRVNGVEALLRWESAEFGFVSPATFIPLAEETGLILPIGEWVLEEACRNIKLWLDQGADIGCVSVNVSVLQLLRGDLPTTVSRVLEKTGLPANRLELELTESVIMTNAEHAITVLRDLKRLGVSIAIDDFGTGYSSLIYLKRLPIDTLKIDKEFVLDLIHDPDDAAIVTTIITMAHTLGLSVVAEGVEQEGQLNYLREQGCDEIQGFLIARSMRSEACYQFLLSYPQRAVSVLPG